MQTFEAAVCRLQGPCCQKVSAVLLNNPQTCIYADVNGQHVPGEGLANNGCCGRTVAQARPRKEHIQGRTAERSKAV